MRQSPASGLRSLLSFSTHRVSGNRWPLRNPNSQLPQPLHKVVCYMHDAHTSSPSYSALWRTRETSLCILNPDAWVSKHPALQLLGLDSSAQSLPSSATGRAYCWPSAVLQAGLTAETLELNVCLLKWTSLNFFLLQCIFRVSKCIHTLVGDVGEVYCCYVPDFWLLQSVTLTHFCSFCPHYSHLGPKSLKYLAVYSLR